MLKIILLLLTLLIISAKPVLAVSDPRLAPNNKFGINILSPQAEIKDASTLVNSNGDWGYIVITITKDQRNVEELQSLLNNANQNHLIPIIRLATHFDAIGGYWQRPQDSDAENWADFLSQLYFPTSNRYIEIYNEVNRAAEWGGSVDASDYANKLSSAIDALKAKSDDFFILNAPLDLSLSNSQNSEDAAGFFAGMNASVPGIFSKLDGLASHSYPNPNFSASPYENGRTGIDGFSWELSQISKYSNKDLPVFITETGWKRTIPGKSGLTEDQISQYYTEAFQNIWNDSRVVAAAPFLLSYPEPLFNQFSFKESGSDSYYKYFSAIRDLSKVKGEPERRNLSSNIEIGKQNYTTESMDNVISMEFQNTGNYIWNSQKDLSVKILGQNIVTGKPLWNKEEIYPGEKVKATIKIKTIFSGKTPIEIEVIDNSKTLGQKEITILNQNTLSIVAFRMKSTSASLN